MIKTVIIQVNPHAPKEAAIEQAARLIQNGDVVAFPTETVYGLGANAFSSSAVEKIFIAKGRPAHDPLIVHIAGIQDLDKVAVKIPDFVFRLGEKFWPGPLTLVLPKAEKIPMNVTSNLDTVAVRLPNHPVALALIRASQTPVAAPSANKFSGVSPTTAQHVLQDLNGRIPLILDGGSTSIGVESTVLNCTTWPPQILRPGGISMQDLKEFLGDVRIMENNKDNHAEFLSPGMLDKHYSPKAKLFFFLSTDPEKYKPFFADSFKEMIGDNLKIGAIVAEEDLDWIASEFPQVEKVALGSLEDLDQIASNLYAGLRTMDEKKVNCIFMHDFGSDGVGMAIRDRLMRAAYQVIKI